MSRHTSWKRALRAEYDAFDDFLLDGMVAMYGGDVQKARAEREATRRFWKTRSKQRRACDGLEVAARSWRAGVVIAAALDEHWASRRREPRLILLQLRSDDFEDHAPGEDEWITTWLSDETLLRLADHAWPWRDRWQQEGRIDFSAWLERIGLAHIADADAIPSHLIY